MPEEYDQPGSLLIAARTFITEDKRDLLTLHKATGLPFYWLRDFQRGRTKNPSVNRVQRLIEFYQQRPIVI